MNVSKEAGGKDSEEPREKILLGEGRGRGHFLSRGGWCGQREGQG